MFEIERKFILPQNILETTPKILRSTKKYLEQGYMFENDNAVMRVRLTHNQSGSTSLATFGGITIKFGGGLSRPEFEYDIPAFDALYMMKRTPNRISKTRHYYQVNPFEYEIDVFDGIHAGLIVAEVEFGSVEDAKKFVPHDFVLREVTDDHRFSNSNLSKMNREQVEALLKEVYGDPK